MSKTAENIEHSRRDFLKIASAAAPAAAAAVVMAPQMSEAQAVDLSSTTMQDTAHTRAYYNSARF
ncbi:ubiquinol-cytochrome c reductase iron-sulfur subunit N-terminal domain-containing protein [Pseudopelagicola sp. nBUS_20]|uniref:ubiquinol-cytochrome c reductase iron-sulfur subunit N-terminal domain-containing protein n=1 Tax=Pseudopelagicola sp. nBUS_20 TaxID=3395317 RepID=UPI003EBE200B